MFFNNMSFIGLYSYIQDTNRPFEWVPSFTERIFRHMIPLRMDPINQYQMNEMFKKVLFNLIDLDESDLTMQKLCSSYSNWYFQNFTKFHLDSKIFGFNFKLSKALEFLHNFHTIDWSNFTEDEKIYNLWCNELKKHFVA